MTTFDAILLGVVQGLTEFLPVSSSGHLVVASSLLGVNAPESGLIFEVVVHLGTLVAVVAVYARDLWQVIRGSVAAVPTLLRGRFGEAMEDPGARLGIFIVAATIPTGLMGVLLEDTFERLFGNPLAVGFAFLVTGTVLFVSDRLVQPVNSEDPDTATRDVRTMTLGHALIVGIAQGIAITPGISRSGSTIATGLILRLDRQLAARFSFLLSIPAILGATVLQIRKIDASSAAAVTPLLVGGAAAAISGYLALRLLLRLVDRGRFGAFAWYLWPLGIAVIVAAFL